MNNVRLRLRTAPLTLLIPALLLTACGGTAQSAGSAPSTAAAGATAVAVPGIDAQHNAADIAFIIDMAPHHEGALSMSKLASSRASSPRVKALATTIEGAQAPEIATMANMSRAWAAPMGPAGGGHMAMSMHDDVAALAPLTGPAFDRAFLTRMTAHHQSAVDMARRELAQGLNPQAKTMAGDIVRSQTAEITRMRSLLSS